ncbi:MAG: ribonuclease R [Saprospiraceae bacterium]|nr:ribonuclease R [Saprospiraceae bacterium]
MTKKIFKKKESKERKLTSADLQRLMLQIFKDNPKKQFNPKQLANKLGANNSKDALVHALGKLAEAGYIAPLGDFKYKLKQAPAQFLRKKTLTGVVDMTRSGTAYIECEGHENDVFVAAKNLGAAMHGDLVELSVWTPRGRSKPEGEVTKVLERATEVFVGTIWLRAKHAIVAPTNFQVPVDILVDLDDTKEAKDGDRVIVKVTQWHKRPNQWPKGVVTSVLGAEGSDLEMKVILINKGFQLDFDEEVIAESGAIPETITEAEIQQRRDFREVLTFTIDPEDAKDFDDALSYRVLENGNIEVGVHIADVSHYVKPKTALDKEAFKRSTSVYLVDRVLPMLPERLSNNLCSLRPHEEKLTFSAVFEFDQKDKVVNRWFGKTIIHSDRRFSYEQAQQGLETGEGDHAAELRILNRIAHVLRKDRFKNGAIDFDSEEVRFKLDKNGVPIEVYVKERKDAHMLIEDFMLLANKEVAIFINKKAENQAEIPFVYRIHDYPNDEKVKEFALFAKELGFKMNVNTPQEIAASFNRLAKEADKNEAIKLLMPIAIRTMAKAEYSTENIGHYGLAFDFYSHFTSPIRRYSDVLAHRILFENLGEQTVRYEKDKLQEQCRHISAMERKAMEAERESIKYKQVEFMQKHVGEEFDGFVSGIIERGIFIELADNKCEGMVGFDTMDEPFDVGEGRLRAKGMRSGRVIKMGDRVKVRVMETNLQKRQIEMVMV